MKFTALKSKSDARAFQDQLHTVLTEGLEKLGAQLKQGTRLKYSTSGGTVTFEFVLATDTAEREVAERREFAAVCGSYGLKPEHYGVQLGTRGRLVGFALKRVKFPFIVREAEGKEKLYTYHVVSHLMDANSRHMFEVIGSRR